MLPLTIATLWLASDAGALTAKDAHDTVAEDGSLTGHVTCEKDGHAVKGATFAAATQPKHGELTLGASTGAFIYTPAKDFSGDDLFTFRCTSGTTSTGTVTLTVTAVNDPTTVAPLALTTAQDTPIVGHIKATDADPEPLVFTIARAPQHGAATVDDKGTATYTPQQDWSGADSFAIDIASGTTHTALEVPVKVAARPAGSATPPPAPTSPAAPAASTPPAAAMPASPPAPPKPQPPVAAAAKLTVNEDEVLKAQLECTDPEGAAVIYRISAQATRATLTVDDNTGVAVYVPWKNYHGPDTFSFQCSDGRLRSPPTPVTVDVVAVNDAPTASGGALKTNEDTAAKGTVRAADPDGDKLSFTLKEGPARGDVVVDAKSGAFTFTPARDANGADAFVVSVSDGTASVVASFTVDVAPVQDGPRVESSALAQVAEDTPFTGTLPGTDPDGDPLKFALRSKTKLGTATLVDAATGAWTFAPHADVSGTDELKFDVTSSGATAHGVVKIVIAAVNDPPTVDALVLEATEDTPVEGAPAMHDVDDTTLTLAVATPPARGTATVANGVVRFVPAKDDVREVTFEVVAKDAASSSSPARVTVHIAPANDPPVAKDAHFTTEEDASVRGKLGATDVDGDVLKFRVGRAPDHGKAFVRDNGNFEYVPAHNISGDDSFTFIVTDAQGVEATGTVTIAVTDADDPPVASSSRLQAPHVGQIRATLSGYDPEGKPITFRITEQPAFGHVELLDEHTGAVEVVTDGGGRGSTFFRFVVSDGALTSDPGRVDLDVR